MDKDSGKNGFCVIVIKSMLNVLCAICHFPPALPLTPYQLVLTALNSNIMSSDTAHNSRVAGNILQV